MGSNTQTSSLQEQIETLQGPTMKTPQSQNSNYSTVTQRTNGITKEHAITMRAIEGLTVIDYAIALGKLITPKNISHQSKISGGRVCFYLTSRELVDKLTRNNVTLKIKEHVVEIRPLSVRTKKILLSNIDPFVPDSYIEEKLREFGVRPTSRIIEVKAGMTDPDYAHILCFKRIVYVLANDVKKLPSKLRVNYEDSNKMMYISEGQLKCFVCQEEGHRAKDCENEVNQTLNKIDESPQDVQNKITNANTNEGSTTPFPSTLTQNVENYKDIVPPSELETTPIGNTILSKTNTPQDGHSQLSGTLEGDNSIEFIPPPVPDKDKVDSHTKIGSSPHQSTSQLKTSGAPSSNVNIIQTKDKSLVEETGSVQIQTNKRSLSISSKHSNTTNESQQSIEENNDTLQAKSADTKIKVTPRNAKKKRKISVSQIKTGKDIKSSIVPATEHFTLNADKYPLAFDGMVMFLEDSLDSKDIIELSKNYTDDIQSLAHMLAVCIGLVPDKELKNFIATRHFKLTGEPMEFDEEDANKDY